jgi:N-methylhydantoinase B
LKLQKGDICRVQYAGGGACGKPFERNVHRVLEDVRNGYISSETARSVYGVVISGRPPAIDHEATREIRNGVAKP